MSMEAIGRVPVIDWLMGVAVLVCGVVAVIAVWRCCDRLGGAGTAADEGPDEGHGRGHWPTPLALPPGPTNGIVLPDQIDEELWKIIDDEQRRTSEVAEPDPTERIAARARGAGGDGNQRSDAIRHVGQRHSRSREDRRAGGSRSFPRLPRHDDGRDSHHKRRSWTSRAGR